MTQSKTKGKRLRKLVETDIADDQLSVESDSKDLDPSSVLQELNTTDEYPLIAIMPNKDKRKKSVTVHVRILIGGKIMGLRSSCSSRDKMISRKQTARKSSDEDDGRDFDIFDNELSDSDQGDRESDSDDSGFEKRPWAKKVTAKKSMEMATDNTDEKGNQKQLVEVASSPPSSRFIPRKKKETDISSISLTANLYESTLPVGKNASSATSTMPVTNHKDSSNKTKRTGNDGDRGNLQQTPMITSSRNTTAHQGNQSSVPTSTAKANLLVLEPKGSFVKKEPIHDKIHEDLNKLIKNVILDEGRLLISAGDTVDMFGTFRNKEDQQSLDIFDKDQKGKIVLQPKVPMFPEEFASGQKSLPLSWWGIVPPPEWIIRLHHHDHVPPHSGGHGGSYFPGRYERNRDHHYPTETNYGPPHHDFHHYSHYNFQPHDGHAFQYGHNGSFRGRGGYHWDRGNKDWTERRGVDNRWNVQNSGRM